MGGSNPYIDNSNVARPTKPYQIRFLPMDVTIQVDPAKLPYDDHGLEGSILEIAMGHGIDIDHACGGVCACSTCHILVKEGLETCNDPIDAELDQLDNAPKTTFQSRLACQTVPNGSRDITVQIPSWNRNLAREGS
jgi:ferredoxin, 2Fe-2S